MLFYENHILKSSLGRITENTPGCEHLFNEWRALGIWCDSPINTEDCRRVNPSDIVCFHQVDVGEYLHLENTLMWLVVDMIKHRYIFLIDGKKI